MADNTHSIDWELSSSQYSARADTADLSFTSDLTFEGWFKFETLPSSDIFTFLSKWDGAVNAGAYVWDLQHDGANYLFRFVHNDGTANETQTFTLTGGNIPTTDTWLHYAMRWDASASTVEFLINGVDIGSDTGTQTAIQDTDKQFNIAARDDGSGGGGETDFFDGKMNNIRVWSDLRTDAEISNNRNVVLTNTGTDNLVDAWYYNNNHNSASGNNDLTASGSPVFSTDVPFVTAVNNSYFYFM